MQLHRQSEAGEESVRTVTVTMSAVLCIVLAVALVATIAVEEFRIRIAYEDRRLARECCQRASEISSVSGRIATFCEFSLRSVYNRLGITDEKIYEGGIGGGP
jgi:hypothetical protein